MEHDMTVKTHFLSAYVRMLNEETPCKDLNDFRRMTFCAGMILSTAKQQLGKRHYLKIAAALPYSAKIHHGEYRKDGVTPYLLHLLEVTCILISLKVFDYQVLCAAILHDTVELEKKMSGALLRKKELGEVFGEPVMKIVNLLSKRPGEEPTTMWKRMLRERNKNILWRVLVIKYADRIHNVRTFAPISLFKVDEKVKETDEWFPELREKLESVLLLLWKRRTIKKKRYLKLPERLDYLLRKELRPYAVPFHLDQSILALAQECAVA